MDLRERVPGASSRRHPWEISRFEFFWRLLESQVLTGDPVSVLDAGAGDGWLAAQLAARLPAGSRVVCWDTGYGPDDLEQLGSQAVAELTFTAARPRGERFDVALLLDVIEHVPDDVGFLTAVVDELVAEGGWALISVPAWMALFSDHDHALLHYRRYGPAQLRAVVLQSGLEPVVDGGLFHSLLLPRVLRVASEHVFRRRTRPANLGAWSHDKWVTRAVLAGLRVDNALSSVGAALGLGVPGLSQWVLAHKPREDR